MPHEDRRIFFNMEESYRALHLMCQQKGVDRPPPGHLIRMDLSRENPFSVDAVFENHKTNHLENSEYTKDFVVAALMQFCRSTGIPLPKGANKTLEITSEKIILRVQILR